MKKTRNFRERPLPSPGKALVMPDRRFEYDNTFKSPPTGKSAVCSVLSEKRKGGPRKNCPVQLTFIEGRPFLRLCTPANVGGKSLPRVVPLPDNGAQAAKKASEICAAWAAGDTNFDTIEHAGLGRLRGRLRRR